MPFPVILTMLNIKDKQLRIELERAGILFPSGNLHPDAYQLVSNLNAANQKLAAIADHLGFVFIKEEKVSHWSLVKKNSPKARISKAQQIAWTVPGTTIPWTHEQPDMSGVRKKRRN